MLPLTDTESEELAEIVWTLNRAGWTIGGVALVGSGSDSRTWVVTGRNGENRVDAEGGSMIEAWRNAAEQARTMGMHRDQRKLSGG